MISNLKEFVCKFVQKQNRGNFPSLYIVDKETGPFRRIQDAIDAAQPSSLIKITEGFYEENLVITQKSEATQKTINARTKSFKWKITKNRGIGVHIKLPYSDCEVNISGLKISHTGNSSELQMQLIEHHQHLLKIFEDSSNNCEQLDHDFITRTSFNKIQNMILFVECGKVSLNLCVFSLKYLVKSCRVMIPALCVERESFINIVDCQIKGNESKETIGILSRLGTVQISNSVISGHSQGGIIIWGNRDNKSNIHKNKFEKNSVGISVMGDEFNVKIYQNHITDNKIGVKIGLSSEAEVSRNYICENKEGIQVYSSFPVIYLNKIDKNQENGVYVKTHKHMISKALIKRNVSISGNKKNGILIEGKKNRTQIIENYLISFNGESGIKVNKNAFPLILKNKIYKNHKEGILITEHSNSVIEKNEIVNNIDCNIALGGQGSHQTLVVENLIKFSPGVGIIMTQGNSHISRNDISENRDGIKMMSSSGNIRRNFICKNKNDGVACHGFCTPILVENLISRNSSLGLFLRDDSGISAYSMIHSNIIVSNEINVGLDFQHDTLVSDLQTSNTIDEDIEQPIPIKCGLM